MAVLKQVAGHAALCEARRRLASHPSTAALLRAGKVNRKGSKRGQCWSKQYSGAMAGLLKEQVKILSLLSSELAVKRAYPELLFGTSLASEGDAHLPLALLRVLCELTDEAAQQKDDHRHQGRLRLVAHKLFHDFFVGEERLLRISHRKTNLLHHVIQKEPLHHLRFALMAKRGMDFWTQRKEQRIAAERAEQLSSYRRKKSSALLLAAARTGETGNDAEGAFLPSFLPRFHLSGQGCTL